MNELMKTEVKMRWREIISEITREAKTKQNGETSYVCPICGHGKGGDGLTFVPGKSGQLKCFGCGWSGDIISLVQEAKGFDFTEALQFCTDKLGIVMDEKPQKPVPKGSYSHPDYICSGNEIRVHDYGPYVKVIYRRSDGKKGAKFLHWENNSWQSKRGCDPVLYGSTDANTVYIAEGEKDVDTLTKLGFTAVTGGASTDLTAFRDCKNQFAGKDIVIFQDNDEAGQKFVSEVSSILGNVVASIKTITFEDMPPASDVTDYLEAGNSVEELVQRIADAEVVKANRGNELVINDITLRPGAKNKPLASPTNFRVILDNDLNLRHKIGWDDFTQQPTYRGRLPWRVEGDLYGSWQDWDDDSLVDYIDEKYGFHSKKVLLSSLNAVMHSPGSKHDSLLERLDMLPKWDGKHRVQSLMPEFLGAEKCDYTTAATRLLMFGALARAYHPGCKFDYMIIFIGKQGIGKSELCRMLALNSSFFDDDFRSFEGDGAFEKLRGKWILEVSELLALKRAKDVEAIKAFITSRNDTFRTKYDRYTHDAPRRCIFVATTNKGEFLTDKTGNRRFVPIECRADRWNSDMLLTDKGHAYIEQVWAEVLQEFTSLGMDKCLDASQLIIPKHLEGEWKIRLEKATESDERVGFIEEYLKHRVSGEKTCIPELREKALHRDINAKADRKESNEIADIMDHEISGWVRIGRARVPGYGQQRCWKKE